MSWKENVSQKIVGSNPVGPHRIFLDKSAKENLYNIILRNEIIKAVPVHVA